MKYILLLLLFCSCSSPLIAQKEDYIWRLGYSRNHTPQDPKNTEFNFKDSMTAGAKYWPMQFDNSSAQISDSTGRLLLISNGCYIENAAGVAVPGSEGLNPGRIYDLFCPSKFGYTLFNNMVFLRHPDSTHLYYLFHIPGIEMPKDTEVWYINILYTVVDISANNGVGKVLVKNKPIVLDTLHFGDFHAVRHANGRDWWLVAAVFNEDAYYSILFSPPGLQVSKQNIGLSLRDDGIGSMCFSPDGTKLVRYSPNTALQVFDFDRCSGLLSNPQASLLKPDRYEYTGSMSISFDSRFFYTSGGVTIEQYDLQSSDWAASRTTVAVWDGKDCPQSLWATYGIMQPGPDGRIYVNTEAGTKCMHRIKYPERKGTACTFQQSYFRFPYGIRGTPHFPNFRLGPIDGSACDTLGRNNRPMAGWRFDGSGLRAEFTSVSWYEPTEWHWTFGDGAVSRDTSPVHTYARAGTYRVCLVVKNQNASDTLCRDITVGVSDAQEALAVGPQVQVLPNPFDASLRVLLPAEAEEARLHFSLCDALGRPVREARLSGSETEIETAGLAAGLYFWVVQRNGRVWQRGRVGKF